jgi:hypothetical protein
MAGMDQHRSQASFTSLAQMFRAPFPWETQPGGGDLDMTSVHARAVEFIAKPGKNLELRNCIEASVLPFLETQPGFKGAFVLTPHREPRLVLVFSFWEHELDSRETQWESATEIQRAVSPLVDSFSRVRTYQALFPEVPETKSPSADLQPC